MNLYLDDNSNDPLLATLLRRAAHVVICPQDVNLAGKSDARHLEHAIRAALALVTADRDDFHDLHDLVATCGGNHSGILLVRYDNDPSRDMKPRHIVTAIGRLERAGIAINNQLIVLNHWR